jgi:hypothetical protein
METIDGLENTSLDNDFLNWLSNNIFSGMGIPSAFLSEVENIDFAKTLAMQNSRLIRDIVAEQVTLGKGLSELLRKIYAIEFFKNDDTESKDSKKEVDDSVLAAVDSIEVRFPSPVSLNMTNLADQINNITTLMDPLIEALTFPEDIKDIATPIFKQEMFRKYLPSIHWRDIEEIMKTAKTKAVREKIKNKKDPEEGVIPPTDGAEAPTI